MVEAGPLKQKVFSVRTNPPRFAPEGYSSSSRGRSQTQSLLGGGSTEKVDFSLHSGKCCSLFS